MSKWLQTSYLQIHTRIICIVIVNLRHIISGRIFVYDLRDLDNRRQIDMYDLCCAKTYHTRFA